MSNLRPCPECDRHVKSDETTCPFCSTAIEAAAPERKLPIGRLTRAAVFAGALAGASACGPAQSKETLPDKTPPPAEVADAGAAEPEQTTPDAAPQPPPPPDDVKRRPPPDHNVPMPYGAPPARHRLV